MHSGTIASRRWHSLLDRYFALKDDFDHAQAYVDRATALLALGRVEEAIESYTAALAREAVFPNLQTQAYLELPYLIATRGLRQKYDDAMEILEKYRARLTSPVGVPGRSFSFSTRLTH